MDPVFGREQEVLHMVQILSRKTRNNPLLIGEAGVGRASIVYALAKRIIAQDVPSHVISREVLALDIASLISGTTLRGQLEERIKKDLAELFVDKLKAYMFHSFAVYHSSQEIVTALIGLRNRGLVEQIGVSIVRRALEEPLRQIVQNAGKEGAVVV